MMFRSFCFQKISPDTQPKLDGLNRCAEDAATKGRSDNEHEKIAAAMAAVADITKLD